MYLTATCPDLMLSRRYMTQPTKLHLMTAKKILRYLQEIVGCGIFFYSKGGKKELIGYIDSDYARSLEDRKSTSGYAFILSFGVVTWSDLNSVTGDFSLNRTRFIIISIFFFN